MQLNPPPAAAVAAFIASVQKLTNDQGRLLLAVSGGPDSLAMLMLAHAALPRSIIAATVDHGLRPEATAEAEFVYQLCTKLDVAHHILRPDLPIIGNIQSEARMARYALLSQHAVSKGCNWIATAHHADDQLETVLMRVARGSGIDGLAAVRQRQDHIIRPMLSFRKAELEAICTACNVTAVQDPSNENDRYDRVAMRQWLAEAGHPFDALRAVRSASAFADAAQALDWMTERLYQSHVHDDGKAIILQTNDLPREMLRRLTLRIIGEIQPGYAPRGEALDQAMLALKNGTQCMLGNVLCEGQSNGQIESYAAWRFRPAPQRRH